MGMYRVLTAGERDAGLAGVCALAVMAKAPRAGQVKTRLAPPLTLEQSAALNICFLRDTTQNLAQICAQNDRLNDQQIHQLASAVPASNALDHDPEIETV